MTMLVVIAPNATVSAVKPRRIRADSVLMWHPHATLAKSGKPGYLRARRCILAGLRSPMSRALSAVCLALLMVSSMAAQAVARPAIAVLGLEVVDPSGTPTAQDAQ